jgi:hypothetical protein
MRVIIDPMVLWIGIPLRGIPNGLANRKYHQLRDSPILRFTASAKNLLLLHTNDLGLC